MAVEQRRAQNEHVGWDAGSNSRAGDGRNLSLCVRGNELLETHPSQQLLTTIRRLPVEDFPKLKTICDGFCPLPETSIVFIAEEGGEIVGRIMLLSPVHVEGPWVAQHKRGTNLFSRLVSEAERAGRRLGLTKLFAYAADAQMEDYIIRLGYKPMRMTVWEKGI